MKVLHTLIALLLMLMAGNAYAFDDQLSGDVAQGQAALSSNYADLDTAVSYVSGIGGGTIIIDNATSLTADLTIPATIGLLFFQDGSIDFNNKQLTINGSLIAPLKEIFTDGGSTSIADPWVVFGDSSVEKVYPQWFGCIPNTDGSTDNHTTCLQRTIDAATYGRFVVHMTQGDWYINDVVLHSYASIEGVGNYTDIKAYADGTYIFDANGIRTRLTNLEIDGNGKSLTACYYADNSVNGSTIYEVSFRFCPNASVFLNDTRDFLIERSYFTEGTSYQIRAVGSPQLRIVKNQMQGAGNADLIAAIHIDGGALGNANATQIIGNWFEYTALSTMQKAIELDDAYYVKITDNKFNLSASGLTCGVCLEDTTTKTHIYDNNFQNVGAATEVVIDATSTGNKIEDLATADVSDASNGNVGWYHGTTRHNLSIEELNIINPSTNTNRITLKADDVKITFDNNDDNHIGKTAGIFKVSATSQRLELDTTHATGTIYNYDPVRIGSLSSFPDVATYPNATIFYDATSFKMWGRVNGAYHKFYMDNSDGTLSVDSYIYGDGGNALNLGSGNTCTVYNDNDDVCVGVDLQVMGSQYITGNTTINGATTHQNTVRTKDNIQHYYGSAATDGGFAHFTAETNDSFVLWPGIESNRIILKSQADRAVDTTLAQAANPTFTFMSQTFDSGVTEYGELSHDGSNVVINAGKGFIQTSDGSKVPFGDANSATYTVNTTDQIIGVSYSSTGVCTVTIDSDNTVAGRHFTIKDTGGGAASFNISIQTEGAENIDGAATATIGSNYGSVDIFSDGTNYFIK